MSDESAGWTKYESYAVFHYLVSDKGHFAATARIASWSLDGPERVDEIPTALRSYVVAILGADTDDENIGELALNLLTHAIGQVDWFEVAANLRAEASARQELDPTWTGENYSNSAAGGGPAPVASVLLSGPAA